jgi:hypothetical protein
MTKAVSLFRQDYIDLIEGVDLVLLCIDVHEVSVGAERVRMRSENWGSLNLLEWLD